MTENIKNVVAVELLLFTRIGYLDLHSAGCIRKVEICYQQYKNICHGVKFNEREAWKKRLQSRDTISSLDKKFEPYNLFIKTQNDRLTQMLVQEGTSGDHLAQASAQSRVSKSRVAWNVSNWFFNISKHRDATSSLDSLSVCDLPSLKEDFTYV